MAILSIRHKGLRRLQEQDDPRGVSPKALVRIRDMLAALDSATGIGDLGAMPGWRLHPLTADRDGQWSLKVTANLRLVFRFLGEDVTDVDLVDYH